MEEKKLKLLLNECIELFISSTADNSKSAYALYDLYMQNKDFAETELRFVHLHYCLDNKSTKTLIRGMILKKIQSLLQLDCRITEHYFLQEHLPTLLVRGALMAEKNQGKIRFLNVSHCTFTQLHTYISGMLCTRIHSLALVDIDCLPKRWTELFDTLSMLDFSNLKHLTLSSNDIGFFDDNKLLSLLTGLKIINYSELRVLTIKQNALYNLTPGKLMQLFDVFESAPKGLHVEIESNFFASFTRPLQIALYHSLFKLSASGLGIACNYISNWSNANWLEFFKDTKPLNLKTLDVSKNNLRFLLHTEWGELFFKGLNEMGVTHLNFSENQLNKWAPITINHFFKLITLSKVNSLTFSNDNPTLMSNEQWEAFLLGLKMAKIKFINLSSIKFSVPVKIRRKINQILASNSLERNFVDNTLTQGIFTLMWARPNSTLSMSVRPKLFDENCPQDLLLKYRSCRPTRF